MEREKREFAEQLRKSQPQQKPSPISKPSNTKSSNRPSNTAFDPKLPRVQTPTRDLRSSRGHVASDESDHVAPEEPVSDEEEAADADEHQSGEEIANEEEEEFEDDEAEGT